jgi:hypothetical protein
LQKLYQQVQTEDSEWYYQTFSKLLDVVVDDPLDFALCEKSGANNVGGKERLEAEVGSTINKIIDNVPNNETTLSDNTDVDSKKVEIEIPPPSDGSETNTPAGTNQLNVQEVD